MNDVVFLVDARTPTERQVIDRWIAERGVSGTTVGVGDVEAVGRVIDTAAAAGTDPQLAPLGVVWLAPLRDGERRFRVRDTLTPGDPRHPPRLVQRALLSRDPGRADVVVGAAAPLSEVLARHGDGANPAAFVARQAKVALQREETRLFGGQHKVPVEVRADIVDQARFEEGLRRFAEKSGRSLEDVRGEASGYLDEMVTSLNRHAVDITAEMASLYHRGGMRGKVRTDETQVEMVKRTAAEFPTVFLCSHRSYLDSTVLAVVLRDNGLPPNHRLGGANMAIGLMGTIGRRNGIIYIRRSFRDNELYKWVLREYLGYLAGKRFSLEWNIEGTRSRTGTLGQPKLGLLSYIASAYLDGRCEDYKLIPVSIVYDELIDVEEFTRYAKGGAKSRESVRSMVAYARRTRALYGRGDMYVGFGEPVSLREMLGPPPPKPAGQRVDLAPVAAEVAARINNVTPITPTALVAMMLLSARRPLTMTQLRLALDYFAGDIERRQLPLIKPEQLKSNAGVERAMAPLLRHNGLTRVSSGPDELYSVADDQRLVASYYRNSVLHHFIDGAIAQLALHRLGTTDAQGDPVDAILVTAQRLRSLLRYEFYFPSEAEFAEHIERELSGRSRTWRAQVRKDPPAAAASLLGSWRPLTAAVVLRAIVEAYLVVALVAERGDLKADGMTAECLAYGQQLLADGRIRNSESISALLFDSGAKLIAEEGPIVDELTSIARALDEIEALAEAQFD